MSSVARRHDAATQSESMESLAPAKCQTHMATLAKKLSVGLCLCHVLVSLLICASLSVCLHRPPLSQTHMPSALAPHLWTSCPQSRDSSTLCAVSVSNTRHLLRLYSLHARKRDESINRTHQ